MNTPPGLLACACALWGAQTGYWLIAAVAAIALEAPRVVHLRWDITQAHFNRLTDFCSVLIVAVAGYLYVTFGNPRALMLLFQWLPVLLTPVALAQAWGNLPKVGVAAFVWTLRKGDSGRQPALNLGHPYLAIWVIAAAASNARGPVFFAGLAALVAWALWTARPRRSSVVLWVVLVGLSAAGGYGLHHGLNRMQAWIEDLVPEWLAASGSRTDPYKSRTDLGHIGSLKQDDAIVLRVRAPGRPGSLLLHRASYNGYFDGTWSARNAPLVARLPEHGTRWPLRYAPAEAERVTVFDYSPRGNPVLSLPSGTVELSGLEALSLKVNALGTVQAESPPGYFSYVATVSRAAGIEAAPDDDDLRLPQGDQPLFKGVAQRLGLAGLAADETAAAVRRYFADGFGYSLYRQGGPIGRSALADFLERSRSGHCEHFATATVLLLRAAGVPARYATGFSAQEYSRLEDAYLVRVRHAHAWARVYVGGRWIDLDTTPATWAAIENETASWWSPLADLWSWTRFRLSQLGGAGGEERTTLIMIGAALLVGLWFGWRLYRQRQLMVYGKRGPAAGGNAPAQGTDSELYLLERALAQAGLGRAPGETVLMWLSRIEARLPEELRGAGAGEIAALHYRYRFDPAGLTSAERERLRERTLAALTLWSTRAGNAGSAP
jgi:transglutaminase-like putative cysteine protease